MYALAYDLLPELLCWLSDPDMKLLIASIRKAISSISLQTDLGQKPLILADAESEIFMRVKQQLIMTIQNNLVQHQFKQICLTGFTQMKMGQRR